MCMKDFFKTEDKSIRRNFYIDVIATIVVAVTLFALFFINGVSAVNDSHCYETFRVEVMAEPVYSLFLAFFRLFIHTDDYIKVAVFFQTAFAVFSVPFFVKRISDKFNLYPIFRIALYVMLLLFYTMPAVFSRSGVLTFLAILTEGISYPLFFIFWVYIIDTITDKKTRDWVITFMISVILLLIRTQLAFAVVLAVLAGIYAFAARKDKKALIMEAAAVLAAVIFIKTFQSVFCYTIIHTFDVPPNNISMYGNIMILAEEDDSELFDDELTKSVFIARYYDMTDNGWGMVHYKGDSLMDAAMFYEECYDNIKDHMSMGSYFDDNNITYGIDKYNIQNATAKAISLKLLPEHLGQWIYNYVGLCLVGFIRTVAVKPESTLIQIYTALVYLILIGGIIINRKNKSVVLFGAITVIGVLGQVMETSIAIMCISRYMMYMFPMVYCGIIISISAYIRGRIKSE